EIVAAAMGSNSAQKGRKSGDRAAQVAKQNQPCKKFSILTRGRLLPARCARLSPVCHAAQR
ncbi:MAG: hypothetical protein AB7S55_10710, partial [Thiomonas sp.]